MSEIVVGYDGSAASDAALDTAVEVAAAFGDNVVVAFAYEANPVGGELTDYRTALQEHARGVLARAVERAKAAGVSVESVTIEESPAHGLVDLARSRDARAIVIGTRGERPLAGAILGSTAHKLLHLTDRPVLVIPCPLP